MKCRYILLLLFLLPAIPSLAQVDGQMEKLQKKLSEYKYDTTTPPDDKKTFLARKLLGYSGILNVDEAMAFKRMEALAKGEQTKAELAREEIFFTAGDGKRWMTNAMVHIYRDIFTEKELRKLSKFYKKGAGQKFVQFFPEIMIKAMVAIQEINTLWRESE